MAIVGAMAVVLKAYARNMTALSGQWQVCGKCGGKDIERGLVYMEGELERFLRGDEHERPCSFWK
jgi:hypothetical protein